MHKRLLLSVIICTYNRAGFLNLVLDSLSRQTVSKNEYEIVIIDDGSSDNTVKVVELFKPLLPITYFYQKNSGLAAAKNHGIYASRGELLLFLDDDDITTPTLLEEHIKTHRKYSEQHMAVLHYTNWADDLVVTPVMHFVSEIGCFLFSYPHIKHGDILDYTYFWGGRSSCKRSFLIEHGVFNPVFRFGCEDIELGYRLSKHGLKVVYNGKAVSRMVRAITFDDFCRRLIRQGRSQYVFSTLHDDPGVQDWTEVIGAAEIWKDIDTIFKAKLKSAKELDRIVSLKQKYRFGLDDLTKMLLYKAYWWSFKACKIKGIIEAKEDFRETPPAITSNNIDVQSNGAPLGNDDMQCRPAEAVVKKELRPLLITTKINSYRNYKKYTARAKADILERKHYEKSLITDENPLDVQGFCYPCNKQVKFLVDFSYSYRINGILTPNWREHLTCPLCGLNNRMRASIHLFEQVLTPLKDSPIYLAEQTTSLYQWFSRKYQNLTGSEYLEERVPSGNINENGIRNENLSALSFPDNRFDYILSFDVFEHVPLCQKAFRECHRVLRPEGSLFFTAPFSLTSQKNIIRASKNKKGGICHFYPPEYHSDPLQVEGCLAYYCFGWEMLKHLKKAGFTHITAHLYWSRELGYLGENQVIFIAEKKLQ